MECKNGIGSWNWYGFWKVKAIYFVPSFLYTTVFLIFWHIYFHLIIFHSFLAFFLFFSLPRKGRIKWLSEQETYCQKEKSYCQKDILWCFKALSTAHAIQAFCLVSKEIYVSWLRPSANQNMGVQHLASPCTGAVFWCEQCTQGCMVSFPGSLLLP